MTTTLPSRSAVKRTMNVATLRSPAFFAGARQGWKRASLVMVSVCSFSPTVTVTVLFSAFVLLMIPCTSPVTPLTGGSWAFAVPAQIARTHTQTVSVRIMTFTVRRKGSGWVGRAEREPDNPSRSRRWEARRKTNTDQLTVALSQQPLDDLGLVDDLDRPAAGGEQGVLGGDAELVVDGGEH